MVTSVHGTYLRYSDMTFIDERDEIIREIVDEAERPLPLFSAVQVPRIVLDSRAISHFLNHFQIIFDSLFQSFGLELLSDAVEILHLFHEVILNHAYCLDTLVLSRHEVSCRINRYLGKMLDSSAGYRIDQGQCIYLISEKLYPYSLIRTSQINIHGISAHPESASFEIRFSAAEQRIYQMVKQPGLANLLTYMHIHCL